MENQVSTLALFLIGASGGMGALVAGLVTAWVNSRNENRAKERATIEWYREKKYEAYSKLVFLTHRDALNRVVQNTVRAQGGEPKVSPDDLEIRMNVLEWQERAGMLYENESWPDIMKWNKQLNEPDITENRMQQARTMLWAVLTRDMRNTTVPEKVTFGEGKKKRFGRSAR